MKSTILISISLFLNQVIGQNTEIKSIRKGDFPEGLYKTLEDVLNKKPSFSYPMYFKAFGITDSHKLPEKAFFIP